MKEKKVSMISSNPFLADTFNWAANKIEQFVMTGKTGAINVWNNDYEDAEEAEYMPSYWAGYYDRTAFYTRDFVHQATGGQIAGMADENYSMFEAFAKQCTESRGWYTLWALNFDGSPYMLDYVNDSWFVREVPAQFELVEKAYEQYLWSGDKRYIEDENMWNFYTNVMTKYVESHDGNDNGVAQEVGTGIFTGSSTYNERGGRTVIEAGDAIGSQYQATLAYAGMLKARGEEAASEEWYQKAAELKKYFNEEWSTSEGDMDSGYVCAWGPNGERYSDFSKETSWFMPLKQITEPGERNDAYIDFVLENLGDGIGTEDTSPANIEAYTYIPDMLFPYNRSDDAWKWMKYISSVKDEPHERPIQGTNGDYPEISFTFVSHAIEGMMGVEPDAGANFVATSPRLPSEVPDMTAQYMQIGDYELTLTHSSNTDSTLTNHTDKDITWEARFYGEHDYIQVDSQVLQAEQKELNGEIISYVTATVGKQASVNAKVIPQSEEENLQAAKVVIDMIQGIGEVTLDSKEAITAARTAYEALSEEAKALVNNLDVLKAAEARLAELEQNKELTEIKITCLPEKTEYAVGEAFEAKGLVVEAVYSDNSTKELTKEEYTLSGFDSSKAGEITVSVSYEGKSAEFTVKVNAAKELKKIKVSHKPEKTKYYLGEELDTKGLAVQAVYSDGSKKEVQDYSLSGFDSKKTGKQTITVTYEGKTAKFTVRVREVKLKSITVTPPAKTTYQVGEELDITGMKVMGLYSDKKEAEIKDYEISDLDSTKAGKKKIVVTFQKKADSFTVEVVKKLQEEESSHGKWVLDNTGWWYQHSDKSWSKNGWELINGHWYLFNENGYMETGWKRHNNTWYYLNPNGDMATGWVLDGDTWYYMNESGAMQFGWIDIGGKWYYLNESGAMQSGWLYVGGSWYYLNESGAMQTGWYLVGGTWYYSDRSGAMASETWVGNYYVNASGAWVRSR